MIWRYSPLLLVLLCGAWLAWRQGSTLRELHQETAGVVEPSPLAPTAESNPTNSTAQEAPAVPVSDQQDIEAFRVRGEIGRLARQAREAQQEADLIRARIAAEDRSAQTLA